MSAGWKLGPLLLAVADGAGIAAAAEDALGAAAATDVWAVATF